MYIDGVDKWEKVIETNTMRKTTSVYKAENGYIIHICAYDKRESDKLSYEDRNKVRLYISKTNPLAGLDKVEDKIKISLPLMDGEIEVDD